MWNVDEITHFEGIKKDGKQNLNCISGKETSEENVCISATLNSSCLNRDKFTSSGI